MSDLHLSALAYKGNILMQDRPLLGAAYSVLTPAHCFATATAWKHLHWYTIGQLNRLHVLGALHCAFAAL